MTNTLTPPQDRPPAPPRRSGAWVAALVTIIGVVTILVILTSEIVGGFTNPGGSSQANYSIDVDGVTRVEIEVSAAHMTTSFDDIDEAQLNVFSTGGMDAEDWTFRVDGDVLRISQESQRWFWPLWNSGEMTATLLLPEELEGTLNADLQLSAGELDVTGDLREVSVDISAGSFTFDGASTALSVEVSAGNATFTTDSPRTVDLDVSAGRVVGTVTGQAPTSTSVDVSAGSTILNLPDADYELEGDVSAGDRQIEVRTSPSSEYLLEVDISAGSVTVGYSH